MSSDLDVALRIRAEIDQARTQLSGIDALLGKLGGTGTEAGHGLTEAGAGADHAGQAAGRAAPQIGSLDTSLRRLTEAAGAYLGAQIASQIVMAADNARILEDRVKAITAQSGDFADVWQRIYAISQQNGVAVEGTVALFQRLQTSADRLGASNQDILSVVRAVQQLGRAGGSTAEEISQVSVQFGQMLSSPLAQAEELNSILDGMPALARAIEQGLKIDPGGLKAAAEAGLQTSKIFDTLLKQSAGIDEKAKAAADSIAQGLSRATNGATQFLEALDKSAGATKGIAAGFNFVGEMFDFYAAKYRQFFDGAAMGIDPRLTGAERLNALIRERATLQAREADLAKQVSDAEAMSGAGMPGYAAQAAKARGELAATRATLAQVSAEVDKLTAAQAAAAAAADNLAKHGGKAGTVLVQAAYDGANGFQKLASDIKGMEAEIAAMNAAINGPVPSPGIAEQMRSQTVILKEAQALMMAGDLPGAIAKTKEGAAAIQGFIKGGGTADLAIGSLARQFEALGKAAATAAKEGKSTVEAALAAQNVEMSIKPKLDEAAMAALLEQIKGASQTITVRIVPEIVGGGFPGGGSPASAPDALQWEAAKSGDTPAGQAAP